MRIKTLKIKSQEYLSIRIPHRHRTIQAENNAKTKTLLNFLEIFMLCNAGKMQEMDIAINTLHLPADR